MDKFIDFDCTGEPWAFLSMPCQMVKNDEKDMIETGRWVSQIEKTAERIWLKLDSILEPSWPKSKDLPQDHNNIPTGWWSTLWIRSVIYYILHIAVFWILVKLCVSKDFLKPVFRKIITLLNKRLTYLQSVLLLG